MEPSARYLRAAQLSDGGRPYAAGVTQSDADDSAVAVTFLAAHGAPEAAPAVKAGAQYLLNLQNSDGGFPTFVRGAPSDVEITAKCVRALLASPPNDESHRAARRAWRWLETRQRADGGFACEWNLSPAFPVMHMVDTACVLPARTAPNSVQRVLARCGRYLDATSLPGGGWPLRAEDSQAHPCRPSPGQPAHTPDSTAEFRHTPAANARRRAGRRARLSEPPALRLRRSHPGTDLPHRRSGSSNGKGLYPYGYARRRDSHSTDKAAEQAQRKDTRRSG
ncbi:prenyltransferase/squalene oxidase repeat-containing protein [Streptomyces formicae]